MSRTARTILVQYGGAVVFTALAVLLRWLLDPWLGDRLPFLTLFAAVVVAAWYGGRGPALLALVAGALAAAFFLTEPRFSFAIHQPEYQIGLALYGGVGFLSILVFDALRKAQRQAEDKQRQLEQEVVARRAAEKELAEREEFLRITLASIGDAVITTDTNGNVAYLNAVAQELTGWTQDEAHGQPLTTVFRIINEESRNPVENPVEKALREGRVVGLANHTILIARDKTERRIDDSAAPIRDKEGKTFGCVLVFRDVTEQRRQAWEIETSQQTLARLVERCPFGIYIVDADFRIASMNARSQTGAFLHVRPVIGRPFDEAMRILWPEPVAADIIKKFRHTLDTGEPYSSKDFVNPRADVEQVEGYEWELHRITLANGRHGVVCYYFDSTRLRQVERELRENEERLRHLAAELSDADRRKDEFLATLAHELRNPLAPIRNGLQVMKMADGDAGVVEQCRSIMERQIEQMVRLVDDLMDVSRISRGKLELKKEIVPLGKVIAGGVETSRPHIDQMGHELTVTMPNLPIFVDADLTRLAQVFANLLNNAAKYSERGGHIWLTVERQGSDVVVSVRDTGIGIPAERLANIFEMFSQIDRSLEKSQGGLGIGLNLAKRLIEMHGGRIEAKSDGPGRGSEFVVRLPVVVEASVPPPVEPDASAAPKSSLRILIVDDNRDGAESLAMMLKIMGCDTRTAYDGKEGIEAAGDFRPDVVLLDIGMPKLNGYEACRLMRQQPWGEKLILIAVTGWGQEDDRQRSHDAGFDHHMVKPVEANALMKLLSELSVVKP